MTKFSQLFVKWDGAQIINKAVVAKRNFGAIKTTVDGITFDSKGEANRYRELKLLQDAGEIRNLRPHPQYPLKNAHVQIKGLNNRQLIYTADFEYITKEGQLKIEDFKGHMTRAAALRIAVFQSLYGLKVDIIR